MGKKEKKLSVGSPVVGKEHDQMNFNRNGPSPKSPKMSSMFINPITRRKEQRKEKRRLKKTKRFAFSQRKEMPTVSQQKEEEKLETIAEKKRRRKKRKKANLIQKKIDARKEHKQELKDKKLELQGQKLAIANEEKEIRDLEKKLNLKKSRKTLPQSFINDGLDYLFEALDSHWKEGVDDLDSGQGSESDQMDEEIMSDSEEESEEEDVPDSEIEDDNSDNGGSIEVVMSTSEPKPKSILKNKLVKKTASDSKKLKWTESVDESEEGSDEGNDDGLEEESVHESDEENDDIDSVNDDDSEIDSSVKKDFKKLKRKLHEAGEHDDGNLYKETKSKITTEECANSKKLKPNKTEKQRDPDKEHGDRVSKSRGVKFSDENEIGEGSENDHEMDNSGLSDDDDDDDNDDYDDNELREDIYGRTRDKDGNIVKLQETGTYIPPARRAQLAGDSGKRRVMLERLKKQLKGLINRASESNMQPISSQIEEMYMSNSRADVNELLTGLLLDSCVTPTLTPERLCQELCMLVAILHGNVGMEVGAFFLQTIVKKFDANFSSRDGSESKEMDNIVCVLANLYNFKIVQSTLLFDAARKFVRRFGEKDIEMILVLLKTAGFSLRKEDPAGLKDLIMETQTAAGTVDTSVFQDKSRIQFMLETLLAIKNNNMRKIPNYDPQHLDHLRKLIRNYIRNGNLGSNQLNIGLEDLLKAEERGRWWVVGSAWGGRQQEGSAKTVLTSSVDHKASTQLMDLARKQRMNTDVRKTIFYIIMTSEDFIDAFEKLLKLGLKHQQEREIIHVILDCCLQEKKYNPYYAYLAQKFCELDRRFQMTIQYSLWDKFKEMGSVSQLNQENLASFVVHLMLKKSLSLSVLKVVEFGTLEKPMVRFLKSLLKSVVMATDQKEMEAVFERIAPLDKLRHLQEGLKLFMKHFLLCGKTALADEETAELTTRLKVAEKALSLGQHSLLL